MPFALVFGGLYATLREAISVSLTFFRVLIPIIIGLKILTELDWIRYLALPLEPIMHLTGLPPSLGIVWATGLMVNFYSALIAFMGLLPSLPPITVEQMTTLATMMLLAHSLPAEGRIAQQCGVSFLSQAVIRLVVAVIAGMAIHFSCQHFGWLAQPANIVFKAAPPTDDLLVWAVSELYNLWGIFCIIFVVMLLQRILRYCRIADLMGVLLSPMLRMLGVGSGAALSIIVGVTAGITCGSGVLVKEAQSGVLTPHEVFTTVTFIGLSHALIEDTLLMLLLDAHLGGVLFLRFGLAFTTCVLFNVLYLRLYQTKKALASERTLS